MTKSDTKLIKIARKTTIPKAIIKKAIQKAFGDDGYHGKKHVNFSFKP